MTRTDAEAALVQSVEKRKIGKARFLRRFRNGKLAAFDQLPGSRQPQPVAVVDGGCTGVFPEQAANWDWFSEKIKKAGRPIKVLNLFAYTGGATVAAAKAGASVVSCRRGGASAAFDRLNKYFTISKMFVVGSQYWNSVHGGKPGEAMEDAEGLQTMRTLARNMAFLMKSIALGKAQYGLPEKEPHQSTNFIR